MAVCEWCDQVMMDSDGCTEATETICGVGYQRIPYVRSDGSDGRCHDCNCKSGHFHHPGCDMEQCARCGGQAICCPCCYEDEEDEDNE